MILAKYEAKLYVERRGHLDGPYKSATIEVVTRDDAIQKSKDWAKTVDIVDSSFLRVFCGKECIATFRPGEP
jgi:hypothetical protein